ncbi:hypothetical protein [Halorussus aquaticus]|uniref:Uncharacterized protein n=1 Tax=Halorussus aquaticus TaxID=2953748 RepID=A0ABD5PZY1_9EURY|nr:hypothetical protein [Halorussus aquaticus]
MSGDFDSSHPARKIDPKELKEVLKERNKDVPAVTRRVVAQEFPNVEPDTVSNNLERLVQSNELCKFNDGDINVYWYPRTDDEGGTTRYSELLDDSIDWDEVEISSVPEDTAEEIASKRLPYYRPQNFWTRTTYFSQLGVMVAFGLVLLGIGGLVGGTLGLGQKAGAQIFRWGLYLSLVAMLGYIVSVVLDNLATRGYVTKDPVPERLKLFQ